MFSEKFFKTEAPKFSVFESAFAELNTDLGYSYSELSGHNPEEGIWKVQLHELVDSNVSGNVIALSREKTEGYVRLLDTALENDTENQYLVTIQESPSIHINIEVLPVE
jgi:hypothetical protein